MRGFSLVEIIIYIAILAVISVGALNTFILTYRLLGEVRLTRMLNASAAIAMERLTRTIRDAQAVNVGASTFDTSPGVLSLTGTETPPLTHRFSVETGSLKLESGIDPAVYLTPAGVEVTNFVVRHIIGGSATEGVKIELTLDAALGRATESQNFFDTVILRGAYAP